MGRSVESIKRKYGKDAFVRWGRAGGNPLLLAVKQGYKVTVHKKRKGKG